MFKKNESGTDRLIRAIIGLILLIVSYYYLTGWVQIVGYILGVISVITAITGFCGLYKLLGISTIKKEEPKNGTPSQSNLS